MRFRDDIKSFLESLTCALPLDIILVVLICWGIEVVLVEVADDQGHGESDDDYDDGRCNPG